MADEKKAIETGTPDMAARLENAAERMTETGKSASQKRADAAKARKEHEKSSEKRMTEAEKAKAEAEKTAKAVAERKLAALSYAEDVRARLRADRDKAQKAQKERERQEKEEAEARAKEERRARIEEMLRREQEEIDARNAKADAMLRAINENKDEEQKEAEAPVEQPVAETAETEAPEAETPKEEAAAPAAEAPKSEPVKRDVSAFDKFKLPKEEETSAEKPVENDEDDVSLENETEEDDNVITLDGDEPDEAEDEGFDGIFDGNDVSDFSLFDDDGYDPYSASYDGANSDVAEALRQLEAERRFSREATERLGAGNEDIQRRTLALLEKQGELAREDRIAAREDLRTLVRETFLAQEEARRLKSEDPDEYYAREIARSPIFPKKEESAVNTEGQDSALAPVSLPESAVPEIPAETGVTHKEHAKAQKQEAKAEKKFLKEKAKKDKKKAKKAKKAAEKRQLEEAKIARKEARINAKAAEEERKIVREELRDMSTEGKPINAELRAAEKAYKKEGITREEKTAAAVALLSAHAKKTDHLADMYTIANEGDLYYESERYAKALDKEAKVYNSAAKRVQRMTDSNVTFMPKNPSKLIKNGEYVPTLSEEENVFPDTQNEETTPAPLVSENEAEEDVTETAAATEATNEASAPEATAEAEVNNEETASGESEKNQNEKNSEDSESETGKDFFVESAPVNESLTDGEQEANKSECNEAEDKKSEESDKAANINDDAVEDHTIESINKESTDDAKNVNSNENLDQPEDNKQTIVYKNDRRAAIAAYNALAKKNDVLNETVKEQKKEIKNAGENYEQKEQAMLQVLTAQRDRTENLKEMYRIAIDADLMTKITATGKKLNAEAEAYNKSAKRFENQTGICPEKYPSNVASRVLRKKDIPTPATVTLPEKDKDTEENSDEASLPLAVVASVESDRPQQTTIEADMNEGLESEASANSSNASGASADNPTMAASVAPYPLLSPYGNFTVSRTIGTQSSLEELRTIAKENRILAKTVAKETANAERAGTDSAKKATALNAVLNAERARAENYEKMYRIAARAELDTHAKKAAKRLDREAKAYNTVAGQVSTIVNTNIDTYPEKLRKKLKLGESFETPKEFVLDANMLEALNARVETEAQKEAEKNTETSQQQTKKGKKTSKSTADGSVAKGTETASVSDEGVSIPVVVAAASKSEQKNACKVSEAEKDKLLTAAYDIHELAKENRDLLKTATDEEEKAKSAKKTDKNAHIIALAAALAARKSRIDNYCESAKTARGAGIAKQEEIALSAIDKETETYNKLAKQLEKASGVKLDKYPQKASSLAAENALPAVRAINVSVPESEEERTQKASAVAPVTIALAASAAHAAKNEKKEKSGKKSSAKKSNPKKEMKALLREDRTLTATAKAEEKKVKSAKKDDSNAHLTALASALTARQGLVENNIRIYELAAEVGDAKQVRSALSGIDKEAKAYNDLAVQLEKASDMKLRKYPKNPSRLLETDELPVLPAATVKAEKAKTARAAVAPVVIPVATAEGTVKAKGKKAQTNVGDRADATKELKALSRENRVLEKTVSEQTKNVTDAKDDAAAKTVALAAVLTAQLALAENYKTMYTKANAAGLTKQANAAKKSFDREAKEYNKTSAALAKLADVKLDKYPSTPSKKLIEGRKVEAPRGVSIAPTFETAAKEPILIGGSSKDTSLSSTDASKERDAELIRMQDAYEEKALLKNEAKSEKKESRLEAKKAVKEARVAAREEAKIDAENWRMTKSEIRAYEAKNRALDRTVKAQERKLKSQNSSADHSVILATILADRAERVENCKLIYTTALSGSSKSEASSAKKRLNEEVKAYNKTADKLEKITGVTTEKYPKDTAKLVEAGENVRAPREIEMLPTYAEDETIGNNVPDNSGDSLTEPDEPIVIPYVPEKELRHALKEKASKKAELRNQAMKELKNTARENRKLEAAIEKQNRRISNNKKDTEAVEAAYASILAAKLLLAENYATMYETANAAELDKEATVAAKCLDREAKAYNTVAKKLEKASGNAVARYPKKPSEALFAGEIIAAPEAYNPLTVSSAVSYDEPTYAGTAYQTVYAGQTAAQVPYTEDATSKIDPEILKAYDRHLEKQLTRTEKAGGQKAKHTSRTKASKKSGKAYQKPVYRTMNNPEHERIELARTANQITADDKNSRKMRKSALAADGKNERKLERLNRSAAQAALSDMEKEAKKLLKTVKKDEKAAKRAKDDTAKATALTAALAARATATERYAEMLAVALDANRKDIARKASANLDREARIYNVKADEVAKLIQVEPDKFPKNPSRAVRRGEAIVAPRHIRFTSAARDTAVIMAAPQEKQTEILIKSVPVKNAPVREHIAPIVSREEEVLDKAQLSTHLKAQNKQISRLEKERKNLDYRYAKNKDAKSEDAILLVLKKRNLTANICAILADALALIVSTEKSGKLTRSYKARLVAELKNYNSTSAQYEKLTGKKLSVVKTNLPDLIIKGKEYRKPPIADFDEQLFGVSALSPAPSPVYSHASNLEREDLYGKLTSRRIKSEARAASRINPDDFNREDYIKLNTITTEDSTREAYAKAIERTESGKTLKTETKGKAKNDKDIALLAALDRHEYKRFLADNYRTLNEKRRAISTFTKDMKTAKNENAERALSANILSARRDILAIYIAMIESARIVGVESDVKTFAKELAKAVRAFNEDAAALSKLMQEKVARVDKKLAKKVQNGEKYAPLPNIVCTVPTEDDPELNREVKEKINRVKNERVKGEKAAKEINVTAKEQPLGKTLSAREIREMKARDTAFLEARFDDELREIDREIRARESDFTTDKGKIRRAIAKLKASEKRAKKALSAAKKYAKLDNNRYYAVATVDFNSKKYRGKGDKTVLADLQAEIVALLEERDALNTRLRGLYGSSEKPAARPNAKYDAIYNRARRRSLAKSKRLVKRIRTLRIELKDKQQLFNIINERADTEALIAALKAKPKLYKLRGAAKRATLEELREQQKHLKMLNRKLDYKMTLRIAKDKKYISTESMVTWFFILIGILVLFVTVYIFRTPLLDLAGKIWQRIAALFNTL